jgi:hypothetical protein
MAPRLQRLLPLVLIGLASACGEAAPPADPSPDLEHDSLREGPPTAQWDVVDLLRESQGLEYHASDGGGRASLVRAEGQDPWAVSSTPDRFPLVYEVGPLGIATGGTIYLQVSPFWDWSTPQVVSPDARGFTEIRPNHPEIELSAETLDQQLLGIEVTGRPLVPGDSIEIVYGAGLAGAMPDRYAERDSPFWFAVDGDGDGVRRFLEDSPRIDVRPGPARALLVTLPSVARPGETFRVTLAFVDGWRNSGMPVDAEVVFDDPPQGLTLPASVVFAPEDEGRRSVEAVAREPGTYRLRASAGPVTAQSNPLVVSEDGPRVLWGDLHGHSNYSDGTGVPEDYFVYARDVSALDVAALTDHDHWGILPLVSQPAMWADIVLQTKRFHEPGRFVTLLGWEWTSWIHGHRHVLYFEDRGEIFDSVDRRTESPEQLWAALAEQSVEALTFAHHSAGGPVATNWEFPPDPRFEPVTEIVSIHGSSEALDSPGVIYSPVQGNFVRDVLDRGYRFGFIGSGDRHDGHPGAYQVEPPQGGLAAILAEEPTRAAVLAALRARRVYATNGPRILLRTALAGHRMGESVSVPAGGRLSGELFVHAVAETPLERVELVRSGEIVDGLLVEDLLEVTLQRPVDDLAPGEYVYVRVVQKDGGAAWSSPIYVTE